MIPVSERSPDQPSFREYKPPHFTKSPIFTEYLQVAGEEPSAPAVVRPLREPLNTHFAAPVVALVAISIYYDSHTVFSEARSYQVTDFHLISSTFQPFGILDSPGPYIQAAKDFAQAAVQKVPMRSSSVSVLFILYTMPGSIILNCRFAFLRQFSQGIE